MYYIGISFLLLIFNLFIKNTNNIDTPLYALRSILIPYNFEEGNVIFINLILNYSIVIIFITNIIKNCNEIFSMSPYILTRCNKKKSFKKFFFRVFKSIINLIIIKLIIDILTGDISSFENLKQLISCYTLYILTINIWITTTILLYILRIENKTIYFVLLTVILISQYISFDIGYFSIIVFASKYTLEHYQLVVGCKAILGSILFIFSFFRLKKYEALGGEKND